MAMVNNLPKGVGMASWNVFTLHSISAKRSVGNKPEA